MNDFESKMIEAVAVLQTEIKHIGVRLDVFFARQDLHEERLDRLERRLDGHGERLQGLESTNVQILETLEPVRDSRSFGKVAAWLLSALAAIGGFIVLIMKIFFGL